VSERVRETKSERERSIVMDRTAGELITPSVWHAFSQSHLTEAMLFASPQL